MIALVALWAFAEALVWFVVADVPISAIALRHGFARAARASLVAALAAAVGGLVMLCWAAAAPEASRALLEHIPGIGPALIDGTVAHWRAGPFAAMLGGAFSGTPYKLYAHAAGLAGAAPLGFFAASLAARLPRFLIVAAVSGWLGPRLRRHAAPRAIAGIFAAFWVLFYCTYFWAVGPDINRTSIPCRYDAAAIREA